MKNSTILIGVIALIVLVGAGWVLASQIGKTNVVPTQIVSEPNPTQSETQNTPTKEFIIEGKPFEFNPKEIRVKKGDVVQITFKNNDGFHNLTIEGLSVQTKQISVGQTDTIKFKADQAGTFTFFCNVGTHRQQGMEGKLVVEE